MLRRRIAATTAALALALVPALVHAGGQREERSGAAIVATVIDASVKNADVLATGMTDQQKLDQAVGDRAVQVIQVEQLLDDEHERMLANTIDASTVLSSNRLLARNAVMSNARLSQFAQDQGILPDLVVAIDLMTQPADAVTLYVLDVEELSQPPTIPGSGGTR